MRLNHWIAEKRTQRVITRKSSATCRPWLELLEDRTVPSTILWTNRGSASNDSDGFNGVFGANAATARAVVDQALLDWQNVIGSFNYSSASLNDTYRMTVQMATSGVGLGANAGPSFVLNGKPTQGSMTIQRGGDSGTDRNGDGIGWFLDPTPGEHSEFLGPMANVFSGTAPALTPGGIPNPVASQGDLYGVILHEFGHAFGLTGGSDFRLQSSGLMTLVRDGNGNAVSDSDASSNHQTMDGNGNITTTNPGFLWRFDGPSVKHLMTSFDSQPTITINGGVPLAQGRDSGFGSHSAAPSQSVTVNGVTYTGADDMMNPRFGGGQRRLIPNTMALILKDAYGYTINLPQQFATFLAVKNQTTGALTVRGIDASNDIITVTAAAGFVTRVSVDLGSDIAGTGSLPGSGNLPAFVAEFYGTLNSMGIQAASGDDTINIHFTPRRLKIEGDAGQDTINVESLPQGMISALLDGGSELDTFKFCPSSGNLDLIRSSVTVEGGTLLGEDYLRIDDSRNSNHNRRYAVTRNTVELPGGKATITYDLSGTLDLMSSPAADAIVNIESSWSTFRSRIWSAANVLVGGPSLLVQNGNNTTRDVLGEVVIFTDVFNPQGIRTDLTIDDSGRGAAQTVSITDRNVTGLTGRPIDFLFSRLSSLTINGGSGGNQFFVDSTGPASIRGPLTLNTGIGADTTNLYAHEVPVTINGQRSRDTVNVGRNGNMDGVAAALLITNIGNWSDVTLDDRNDTTGDTVTLQSSGQYSLINGLAPATIRVRSRDLASLNMMAGSGDNWFTVDNTPQSTIPGGAITSISGGSGNDTFFIRRTRNALAINAMAGTNTFGIGTFPVGSLNSIDGAIRLSGTGGVNYLSITDFYTTATLARPTYSYIVDADVIQRTDKAPIYYQDMSLVNLFTSQASDNVMVRSTAITTPIYIDGGDGVNTLDYSGVSGAQTFPGLVSWYKGEGNGLDAVGGNHGTLLGNTNFVPGRVGQSFNLDGDGDYVRVPNAANLEPANVSVEAWVRSSSVGPTAYIIAKGASLNTAASYALYTGGGGLQFYIFDGSTFVLSPDAGPGVWDGQWHHVVGTYGGNLDGGMVRLYVDGAEVGEGTPTSIEVRYNLPTSNDLFIGSYQGTSSYYYYFNGQIDEPSIYNRELSAAEVESLFTNGKQAGAGRAGVTVNLQNGTATGLAGITRFQNVIGSAGNDILVGNGGNVLSGGTGRDLLIAGAFPSLLIGGDGEDLLIGGTTDYDTNEAVLDAIMAEWSRTDIGYEARVSNLLNGDGVPTLNASTVHRNGGLNLLAGGLGDDLFFAQLATELLDLLGEQEIWHPI